MHPFYYFLTVLQLYIKKKGEYIKKKGEYVPIVFISALGKTGMDVKKQSHRFLIYFPPDMVYACYQYSRLQLNVF